MRIVVDEVLCAGHGVCVEVAPEIFEMGADSIARVLIDDVGDEHADAARAAMIRCPAEAIILRS